MSFVQGLALGMLLGVWTTLWFHRLMKRRNRRLTGGDECTWEGWKGGSGRRWRLFRRRPGRFVGNPMED